MIKRVISEFLGTFGIVFAPVALSATGTFHGGDGSLLAAAFVSGLSVLVMIVIFGPISGAHFNPAVTAAFAVGGKFEKKAILPYILAQFAGGVFAAAFVTWLYGGGHGVHIPADSTSVLRNIATEVVLTFLLMLTIFGSIAHGNAVLPPLAIGLVVLINVWIGGPITGASMNPARSLGPALFGSQLAIQSLWLYLFAPTVGACLAALIWRSLSEKSTGEALL